MRRLAILFVLLSAGCASSAPPPPPAANVPDLRGTWTGTWGGTPVTLVVTGQRAAHGQSGLVIGPWQVLGEVHPALDGVLTSMVHGEPISTRMDALVSDAGGGRIILTVRARSGAGDQRMTLRWIAPDRLEGTGDSQYTWGPQGPVQLIRGGQPRAGTSRREAWTVRS